MCCTRCGTGRGTWLTTSYFTSALVCRNCCDQERRHPLFEKAQRANDEALWSGNFEFRGIGLPADLVPAVHAGSAA